MPGIPPADVLRQLTTLEPAPDRDLLARFAAARDGAAFAELVRRHGPVVLAACRRGTRNHHDADDAFQAVFLTLARRAAGIERPELLGSWLYRVAVRVAWRARRSAARRREREVQGVDAPEPVARPSAAPGDLGPVLDQELGALPALYREAVVLCDLRGLSRADAAGALGIPLGTLASRLDGARKKLAARLVRRGVMLSVGAVLVEVRAVAVPDSLLNRTCEMVAVWSNGGALPQPLVKLVQGGVHVRRTMLLGLVAAVVTTVVGVGLAARPEPPPRPTSSASPAVAVAPAPEAQPEPKKAEDAPVKLGQPRLRRTADLKLRAVSAVAWSRDGALLAVAGEAPLSAADALSPHFRRGENTLVVLAPADSKATPGRVPLPLQAELVGFTTDGKHVMVATRETGLISGEYLLHRMTVGRGSPRHEKDFAPPVALAADGQDPVTVPDGADRLTLTGPRDVRFLVRGPGQVKVWHADLTFDSRRPLGAFSRPFGAHYLTPDGRRVVSVVGRGVIEGFDAMTGQGLWATESEVRLPQVVLQPLRTAPLDQIPPSTELAVGLSQDGRRAVVARGPMTPVLVLDLDTGKALPAPADLGPVVPAGPVAVSGDGRLAALAYTPLVPVDGRERARGGDPAFAAATHAYGLTQLTVWETGTGAVVRTWQGRVAALAFHPTRPVLAVLEPHGDATRLGLWDFSAQP